jgi:hypothetical protein
MCIFLSIFTVGAQSTHLEFLNSQALDSRMDRC